METQSGIRRRGKSNILGIPDTQKIKVSVIVVNYNGQKFLKDCLNSIYKQPIFRSNRKNVKIEVIVVDNGSNDGSVEFIKTNYHGVIIIKNSINLGHAEACNQGAKIATGDFLLFLDNDVILGDEFIGELLNTFYIKPDCGVAGGMVKDVGTEYIQEMGINVDYFGYPISNIGTMFGHVIKDEGQFDRILETFYVSSCALMIPRKLFFDVGCFDEKYFMYKDDLDLCWRVKLAGYKVYTNPRAKIYHKMGVTFGGTSSEIINQMKYVTTTKKRYFGERNTIRTILKNYEIGTLLLIFPFYIFMSFVEIVYFLFRFPHVSMAYLKAWKWNIQNIKDTLIKKEQVENVRCVGDKDLLKNMYKGISKLRILKILGKSLYFK